MKWSILDNKLTRKEIVNVKFENGLSEIMYFDFDNVLNEAPKQIYISIQDSDKKSYECDIIEQQTTERTCKFKIINDCDCEKELTIDLIAKN